MILQIAIALGNWPVLDDIEHLILPAVALSTIPMALIARMARSRHAGGARTGLHPHRARQGADASFVLNHAFRNALLPLVTVIGLSLGGLLGGAVLTETVFNLSGVGRILYEAITARDYGIVQGFTVVIAIFFVIFNLIVDISYAYLDSSDPIRAVTGCCLTPPPGYRRRSAVRPRSACGRCAARLFRRKSAILGMIILLGIWSSSHLSAVAGALLSQFHADRRQRSSNALGRASMRSAARQTSRSISWAPTATSAMSSAACFTAPG